MQKPQITFAFVAIAPVLLATTGCESAEEDAVYAANVANGAHATSWNGSYGSESDALNAIRSSCGSDGGYCSHAASSNDYYCYCNVDSSDTGGEPIYTGGDGTGGASDWPSSGGSGGGGTSSTSTAALVSLANADFLEKADLLGILGEPCDYLRPLATFEHAYYFYGGNVGGGVGAGADMGADVVFDLYDQQAATFVYARAVAGTAGNAYVAAGGYTGYGFGPAGAAGFTNVLDAWSGKFLSTTVSLSIPESKVGVNASYFTSPDDKMNGVAVGASIGLDLGIGAASPVGVTAEVGNWVPWNDGTTKLWNATQPGWVSSFFTSGGTKETRYVGGEAQSYLAFASGADVAAAILRVSGTNPAALTAAGEALGIGLMRDKGITIEDWCGSGDQTSSSDPSACTTGTYADVSQAAKSCPHGLRACKSGYDCM